MAECPREALASDLPSGAKVVLAALWSRAAAERRFVWPSRDTLAADCGMAPRTVRKHLAALKERRWVVEHDGPETNGNPGWQLCDPPGTPQILGVEAALGTHDRPDSGTNVPAQTCQAPAKTCRPERAARHERAAEPARTCRPYSIGTTKEPIDDDPFSTEVQGAETSAPSSSSNSPPAPDPEHPSAHAWAMEWAIRWRQELGYEVTGYRLHDPTRGPRKVVALQQALDEYGRTLVESVLLHAGRRVVRHHESDGRFGLHPKMFGALFYEDRPRAWEACLDAWQADEGRRRVSGRVSAPPGELDGRPLTDDEQRAWMVSGGGQDAEQAIRDMRDAADATSKLAQWGGAVLGLDEGAA